MKFKIGDKDSCKLCQEPIEYQGNSRWKHLGNTKPRHVAMPTKKHRDENNYLCCPHCGEKLQIGKG